MRLRPSDIPEASHLFAGLPRRRSALSRWITLSLSVHAIVLTLVLYHHPDILRKSQLPGELTGHNLLLTFSPGESAPTAPPPTPKPQPSPLPPLPALKPPPQPSTAPPSRALSTTPPSTVGTDTFGDGDIKIATVLSHPHPTPDLASLPAGTRGDVIVDVVIDATGHIASFSLSRGLGHPVDDTVLATIQQWTFQPATRNGVPVTSEQELVFFYERG
ncbi:MAG: energy transducer TonB [Acidobacteriota bacterium]